MPYPEFIWNVWTRKIEWPECTSNAVRIFRFPLESGSNAIRMSRTGCKNASRMPPKSISIFLVLKNALRSNAVGICRLLLKCSSNKVGKSRPEKKECPECTSNAFRLSPESIMIFLVLKESNWNALRMPSESLDCRSNAARIQLERPDQKKKNVPNAPRMHLDCRRNLLWYSRYLKNPTEMHFECRENL